MRMIMFAFHMYTRPLRYTAIQCYGPATAQEALSQFQSSVIETITPLTVITLVKWANESIGSIHPRETVQWDTRVKRIKINNDLTIGRGMTQRYLTLQTYDKVLGFLLKASD